MSGLDETLALGEATLQAERRFLDRLTALEPPAGERGLVLRMLSLFEKHHRLFRKTMANLRRNDIPAAFRAGQHADALIGEVEQLLIFELGATKCGRVEDPALVVPTG